MYKFESCLPTNSKIFRQDMCTWWKSEQYLSVIPPDHNFSREMSELYPYPIGIWNPWPFNMGMNNIEAAAFPGFESDIKFYKSSKMNDKTSIPWMNKISEQGFQTQSPRCAPSFHSTYFHQGQLSPGHIPPPFHPSCFEQQGQFSPKQISPHIHPSCFNQQSQLSSRQIPPPVHSSCFKQKGQLGPKKIIPGGQPDCKPKELGPRQIPLPVQRSCYKSYKNSFISSNIPSRNQVCRLCMQNGEGEECYSNHQLKDRNGKVTCPILRKHVCEICNATGDFAHTRAYCPFNNEKNKKPLAVILKQTWHDSSGRIRK